MADSVDEVDEESADFNEEDEERVYVDEVDEEGVDINKVHDAILLTVFLQHDHDQCPTN